MQYTDPLPQVPPPGAPVQQHEGLAPVLVAFPPPVPQSRGTVAIRFFLALPHLVILYALGIAAWLVAFIGWFGALFTGQLPDFAAEFGTGYLRWQARVYAYLALLTDEYPPFAFGDAPYPVQVAVRPGRLNWLAVLFRLILVIPASIVLGVVTYGAFTIVLFVAWLVVLITGRMPDALHWAFAAVVRYMSRVYGYLLMLTSAYPGGLFGDGPAPTGYVPASEAGPVATGPASAEPAPADPASAEPGLAEPAAAEPASAESGSAGPGFAAPSYDEADFTPAAETGFTPAAADADFTPAAAEPGSSAAAESGSSATADPDFDAPAQPESGAPAGAGFVGPADPWTLLLSSSARRLVGWFLVIGVLVTGGVISGSVIASGGITKVDKAVALAQLKAAATPVNQALQVDIPKGQACGQNLSCVTKIDASLGNVYAKFASDVAAIGMPTGAASADAAAVSADATKISNLLDQLGKATTVAQFTSIANASGIQGDLNTLTADYHKLELALGP
jgi:hypothetical protein